MDTFVNQALPSLQAGHLKLRLDSSTIDGNEEFLHS